MSSLLDGVELRPKDVVAALGSLETVVGRLHARRDARAVFPDVYAVITHNVASEVLGRTGFFQEPEWISRLAGRFAERYLETLSWSLQRTAQDCRAWELAYAYADRGLTLPFQDAALGISAHINFDLALGLWRTIEEFGDTSERRLARYKHDHDAVNGLLAASLPEAVARLVERYACPVTPRMFSGAMRPVMRELALFVLERWRAHVWEDVLSLVHASGAAGREAVVARMHRRSGGLGQVLALGCEVRRLGRDTRALFEVPRVSRSGRAAS
jgi:hypothetical protein